MAAKSKGAWLVHDGNCPFCSAYVRLIRLRASVGQLHLIDGRVPHLLVDEIRAAGLNLDDGMVLKLGAQFYHGADCIHALALLSTSSGLFNRLNAAIFGSKRTSRVLYPFMRAGRNTVLGLLRRRQLKETTFADR